jgi:hypothetical protein
VVSTVGEIAAREKINKSYVSRVLRLTLLAPEIVEAIVKGTHAEGLTLPVLMKGVAVEWIAQDRSGRIRLAIPQPAGRRHQRDRPHMRIGQ